MANVTPQMPALGKGTECIKLLMSQVTEEMRQEVIPMVFPALGAHFSGAEFQYPDRTWKEPCGLLGHLVGESGIGKGQLGFCVKAIMRNDELHDNAELDKLIEWGRTMVLGPRGRPDSRVSGRSVRAKA